MTKLGFALRLHWAEHLLNKAEHLLQDKDDIIIEAHRFITVGDVEESQRLFALAAKEADKVTRLQDRVEEIVSNLEAERRKGN